MSSSVRTAGDVVFHNVGPLTTTWSAPSACSTSGQWIYTGVGYENMDGMLGQILGSCSPNDSKADCYPNGDQILEINESLDEDDWRAYSHNYIHSPGILCPAAWETVGVASFKDGTFDGSGVFSSTSFLSRDYFAEGEGSILPTPTRNFVLNALTSVLAPTETAIACCPSGFTAHPVNGCHIYKSLDVLASSTLCNVQVGYFNAGSSTATNTFEYFGATITQTWEGLDIYPTTGTVRARTDTMTFTMDASGFPIQTYSAAPDPSQVAMENAGVLVLVNSGEKDDTEGGESSSEGTESNRSGNGDSSDGDSGNGDSAAQRLRPATSWVASAAALFWVAGLLIGGRM